jgi:hypothetical protein
MNVNIKRIFERYQSEHGFRILVDHLWPRDIKKEKAQIDSWMKEVGLLLHCENGLRMIRISGRFFYQKTGKSFVIQMRFASG